MFIFSKIEKNIKVLVAILLLLAAFEVKADNDPDKIIDSSKKELLKDVPTKDKLKTLLGLSVVHQKIQPNQSIKYSEEGEDLSIKSKEKLYTVQFKKSKSKAFNELEEAEKSIDQVEQALKIAEENNFMKEQGFLHRILAFLFGSDDKLDKAKYHVETAQRVFDEQNMQDELVKTKALSMEISTLRGDKIDEDFLENSDQHANSLKDSKDKMDFFQRIGRVYGRKGQWDKAFNSFQKVQKLALENQDDLSFFENVSEQAEFLFENNKVDQAASVLAELKKRAKKKGSKLLEDFISGVTNKLDKIDKDNDFKKSVNEKSKTGKIKINAKNIQLVDEEVSYRNFYIFIVVILANSIISLMYVLKIKGVFRTRRVKGIKSKFNVEQNELVKILNEDLDFYPDEHIIDMLGEIDYENVSPTELEKVRKMSRIHRKKTSSNAAINVVNKLFLYLKEKESKRLGVEIKYDIDDDIEGFFDADVLNETIVELIKMSSSSKHKLNAIIDREILQISIDELDKKAMKKSNSIDMIYISYLAKLNKGVINYQDKGEFSIAYLDLTAAFSEL